MTTATPHSRFSLDSMAAFIVVCLMGIAPVFWFTPGLLMNTEDLRHAPTPEGWLQYLFMWNQKIGAGAESILDPCLAFFQAIPATLRWLGLPLWEAQRLTFTSWFLFSALSMYGLAKRIFPQSRRFGAPLVTVAFYLFNHWQEHVWLGFKPPLVAAYAILPWLIALILQGVESPSEKKGPLLIKIAIAAFLLAPIGNNISEALAIVLLLGILAGYLMVKSARDKTLSHTVGFLLQTAVLMAIVNAYWMIPQVMEAWNLVGQGAYASGPQKYIGWLQGQSQYTNFFNVIRFLGDWTWYQGVGEPYRLYAELYQSNVFFLLLSCALPLLVAFGVYKGTCKYKSFFACLTFIGIWLSMGSASLFGFAYQWMFDHIPLLWIARSPYFKFMLLVCIGYAVFLGAFTAWLESRFRNNLPAHATSTIFLIAMIMVYAFPLATGKTFPSKEERSYLPPSRILLPDYISKAGEWLDTHQENSRVFALNEDRFWTTDWGYRGFAPFLVHFTTQPVIFKYVPEKILYAQGSPNHTLPLTNMIHQGIDRNQLPRADRLLALLNAKWVLLDRSTRYHRPGDSYQSIRRSVKRQPGLNLERAFGNYEFFSVDANIPFIYTSPDLHVVDGPEEALGPITQDLWPVHPVFLVASQPENKNWENRLPGDHVFTISYNPEDAKERSDKINLPPGQIVFDTQNMEPTGIADANSGSAAAKEPANELIELNVLEGFFLPERGPDGTWIWMEKNNPTARHLAVVNPHKNILRSNFVFKAISFQTDRSLYSYLNGELAQVTPMKGDQPTEVLIKNIDLKPGENIISFYTPFQGSPRGKESVSFGFLKSSFRFQNLIFSGGFKIPQATQMAVQVVPTDHRTDFAGAEQGFKPYLKINGSETPLKKIIKDEVLGFRSIVKLNAGINNFEFTQRRGANAAIFFSPIDRPQENTAAPLPEYKKLSPTRYQLKVSISEPSYLVVSNSFHPGWNLHNTANDDGETIFPHIKVNGFANGFFLQKPGNYDLILVFKPQRLLHLGLLISILGIAVFFRLQYSNRPRMQKTPLSPVSKTL